MIFGTFPIHGQKYLSRVGPYMFPQTLTLLSLVGHFMMSQMGTLAICLATFGTGKWSLSRMDPVMFPQV